MCFKNVKDRDGLSSAINLEFGVEGLELARSGLAGKRLGYHHLLVNRDSIMGAMLTPENVNHIHFGNGKTGGTIKVESGSYLLTLQFSDDTHRSFGEKMSESV